MRTSSLARVVMASLGVSVVITLGCDIPISDDDADADDIFGAVDVSG